MVVENYDSELPLFISFGDGTSQKVQGQEVYHEYSKTGKFKIKVYAEYNNVTKVLSDKEIIITHKIESKDTFADELLH